MNSIPADEIGSLMLKGSRVVIARDSRRDGWGVVAPPRDITTREDIKVVYCETLAAAWREAKRLKAKGY